MTQETSGGIPPWLNAMMTFILRSPLHPLVSKSITLITFTGRKSGKTYTTPVSYSQENNLVRIFTHAMWWKNLTGGAEVTLRLRGRDVRGSAEPVPDDKEAVAKDLREHLKIVRQDARFYGVAFDPDGQPNADDIIRAAQDTIMVRIRLDSQ